MDYIIAGITSVFLFVYLILRAAQAGALLRYP